MKMKYRYGYLLITMLFSVVIIGCTRDIGDDAPDNRAERRPASLTITLNASSIDAVIKPETRNIINPDGSGEWTEEMLLADGRTIRRLTVLLIDSISGEMVAYRHIIYNGIDADVQPIHMPILCRDDDTEGGNGFINAAGEVDLTLKHSDKVRLTFNYDHPLHGDIERLKHGKYVIMAAANYGSLPVKDGQTSVVEHPSVKDKNGFVQQLHAVIHRFYGDDNLQMSDTEMNNEEFLRTGAVGIKDFGTSLAGFYNYVLHVATDEDETGKVYQPFIRKKLDELPLFTVGYIDLQPGDNFLTDPIYLYRTYSRVRIEVKNYSTEPLSIHDLEFSENFSKDRTYFCRMPGATDIFEGLDYTPGAPVVSYGESIIAFPYYNTSTTDGTTLSKDNDKYYIVADTDPSRNEIGTGQPSIKQGQTAAIFDAYISASRDDASEKYRYWIDLGYEGVKDYPSYSFGTTPVTKITPGTYMMKIADKDQWLYETKDAYFQFANFDINGASSKLSDENERERYMWQLTGSDSSYKLQNVSTKDYIYFDTNTYNIVSSGTNGTDFSVSGTNTFTFSWYGYLYMGYSEKDATLAISYSSDVKFELYPIAYSVGEARKRVPVVLQTIDNETHAVSDVKEIRRNDFINILVEVSYNPDRGDFQFEVQPWTTGKGGDITFN